MHLGVGSILTIIFVVLKLTDEIAWSWVWVLSPLWISALLVFILVILAAVITAATGTSYFIKKGGLKR